MQDKTPKNVEGQRHGHWEKYFSETGRLFYKGLYINGLHHGKHEGYNEHGRLNWKVYYIKNLTQCQPL